MATFRYTALDAQSRPVSGQLEAAGIEQALTALASQGLRAAPADLIEVPRPTAATGRLSSAEVAELGNRLGDLTAAGLPLGPGFRAMAAELPRGRLGRVFGDMADRLDTGISLEAAVEAQGKRLPGHVRGLILAGLRSGRPGEAMQQFAAIQHNRLELARRVKTSLAYPAVLLSLALGLFIVFSGFILPQFKSIYDDFGFRLPVMTEAVISFATPWVWPVVVGIGVMGAAVWLSATLPRPAWLRRLFYWFPILGSMWYWTRLAEFARLMQLLLRHQVPLPNALALTAEGMHDPALAVACRRLGSEVETGRSLSEGLARRGPFPASLVPLVRWGERIQSLGEAFGTAADLFERHALVYASLLERVLPPLTFLFILASVGFMVLALFLPMIAGIRSLSGTW